MKIEKVVNTTVEQELDITEISLLTKNEWEQTKNIIPRSWAKYWLKEGEVMTPGSKAEDDKLVECDAKDKSVNVRPALRFTGNSLAVGDSFDFGKIRWTVLLPGVALANAAIGKCVYEDTTTLSPYKNVQMYIDAWRKRIEN